MNQISNIEETHSTREDWRVQVRDWWYSIQDLLAEKDVCLHERKRVEIETIIKGLEATLHTSLVAAVEGLKYQQPHVDTPFHTEDKIYAMNATLDQVLTIINSIFKE